MRKQRIKTISFIIQGAYTLICFSEIVLCLIYKGAYDAAIGRISAEILLHLTFISFLLLLIMLPMSLVLNILAGPQNESRRGYWRLWAILSPVLYIVFWIVSLSVWMLTTGGI